MTSTASLIRRASNVLVLCVLAAQLLAVPTAVASSLPFLLSTLTAPWPAGGGAYAVAVASPLDAREGPIEFIPYRAGGFSSLSTVSGQVVANNQQWLANDAIGQSWTSLGNAPWSPRALGSTIYVTLLVPIPGTAETVNGILLIAGGILANGSATNEVWSSVDTEITADGTNRTLGKNWVLNGGGDCKVSCVSIAFSPRASAGLVVATAFNNQSTVYAYLMGGVNTLVSGKQTAYSDIYYTVGKGITPWVSIGYNAPWKPRYGFGIQPYALSSSVTGVIIAGGVNGEGRTKQRGQLETSQQHRALLFRSDCLRPLTSSWCGLCLTGMAVESTAGSVRLVRTDQRGWRVPTGWPC